MSSPPPRGHTAVLVFERPRAAGGVRARERQLRAADASQRGAVRRARPRRGRGHRASSSKDGTEVHGLIVKPPGYVPGRALSDDPVDPRRPERAGRPLAGAVGLRAAARAPALRGARLRGAGGQLPRQHRPRRRLRARDRAPTGATRKSRTCSAGVDYAVAQGIADPQRLGHRRLELRRHPHRLHDRQRRALQGRDQRRGQRQPAVACTAPTSTSCSTTPSSGRRGRTRSCGSKVSYPFFHADRIHTPTLFLGGDKDFNVPIAGGEQMYQALRTLGVATQLVVYPGEFHVLTRPSFLVDRSRATWSGWTATSRRRLLRAGVLRGRSDQCALRNTQAPLRRSARAVK